MFNCIEPVNSETISSLSTFDGNSISTGISSLSHNRETWQLSGQSQAGHSGLVASLPQSTTKNNKLSTILSWPNGNTTPTSFPVNQRMIMNSEGKGLLN